MTWKAIVTPECGESAYRYAGRRSDPRKGDSVSKHAVGNKGYTRRKDINDGDQCGRIAAVLGEYGVDERLPREALV